MCRLCLLGLVERGETETGDYEGEQGCVWVSGCAYIRELVDGNEFEFLYPLSSSNLI